MRTFQLKITRMKMFINMTKPSPVIAALAEMQGNFLSLFVWKRKVTMVCVTECHWMSRNVTGCHWISQGTMFCVSECHWMSLNVWSDNASCHWLSLDVIECQMGQCLVSVDVSDCSHQAPRSVGPAEWHMQLFSIVWHCLYIGLVLSVHLCGTTA